MRPQAFVSRDNLVAVKYRLTDSRYFEVWFACFFFKGLIPTSNSNMAFAGSGILGSHMYHTPPSFEELGCHPPSWIQCWLWCHGIRLGRDLVTYLQGYGLYTMYEGQPSPRVGLREASRCWGFGGCRNKPWGGV